MSAELRSWKKESTEGRLVEVGSARKRAAERAALAMASSGVAIEKLAPLISCTLRGRGLKKEQTIHVGV